MENLEELPERERASWETLCLFLRKHTKLCGSRLSSVLLLRLRRQKLSGEGGWRKMRSFYKCARFNRIVAPRQG